jgi:YfiH family protein
MTRSTEPIALTSRLLDAAGFHHAFFTRQGGVSPSPWASLNFAASTGDSLDNVRANLAIAARELSADPSRIFFLSQVHGTAAQILEGDEDRTEVVLRQGDVTLSRAPGVVCGVRSADCATVLIGDRLSGAVAAIHAGWRGAARGVVERGVEALRALVGASVDLVAAVGPHIEVCCFEVGDDVAAELAACSRLGEGVVVRGGPKPRVDLRAIVEDKLRASGVEPRSIDHVRGCTHCEGERFFSYRREGQVSGRLLSAIAVRST